MLFQGQEFARVEPVPLLRRPQAGAGRRWCARAAREFLRAVPAAWPTPEMQARARRSRTTRRRFERCKLDFARAASARRRATPCTATCCGCAATTRCSARSGRRGVDGAVLGAEAFVLRFFGDDGRRPAAARQPRPRPAPRPGAGAAARAARRDSAGRCCWSSEDPRYGGSGDAAARTPRTTAGASPAQAAVVLATRRTADAERPMTWTGAIHADAPERDARPGARATTATRRNRCSTREWLVTNGLGGYASGTVAGVPTRRYHGLLIAALPAPLGRAMMLNHLVRDAPPARRHASSASAARSRSGGTLDVPRRRAPAPSSASKPACPSGATRSAAFALREARLAAAPAEHRPRHATAWSTGDGRGAPQAAPVGPLPPARRAGQRRRSRGPYTLTAVERPLRGLRAGADLPPLRLRSARRRTRRSPFDAAQDRATSSTASRRAAATSRAATLWSPGLLPRRPGAGRGRSTLVASTEPWEIVQALCARRGAARPSSSAAARLLASADPRAQQGTAAELVLAADQFLITPAGRVEDAARAHAAGRRGAHA